MFVFFFFNDTATTEIYTLSLHDALPICLFRCGRIGVCFFIRELLIFLHARPCVRSCHTSGCSLRTIGRLLGQCRCIMSNFCMMIFCALTRFVRSEEHTSELQSPCNLVCRLLLEKKKKKQNHKWKQRQHGSQINYEHVEVEK